MRLLHSKVLFFLFFVVCNNTIGRSYGQDSCECVSEQQRQQQQQQQQQQQLLEDDDEQQHLYEYKLRLDDGDLDAGCDDHGCIDEVGSSLRIYTNTTCTNCVFGPQYIDSNYDGGVWIFYNNSRCGSHLSVTFINCTFSDSTLSYPVVQLLNATSGSSLTENSQLSVSFQSCSFSNNSNLVVTVAQRFVSGSFVLNLSFYDSIFQNNPDGVFWTNGIASTGSILFSNCDFVSNTGRTGAAIYIYESYTSVTIVGCSFRQNAAYVPSTLLRSLGIASFINGGAICVWYLYAQLRISGCIFDNNSAMTNGGAISLVTSVNDLLESVIIENSVFVSNVAANSMGLRSGGGAVHLYEVRSITISNCSFDSNSASYNGGAILNSYSSMAINGCDFQSNSAPMGGAVSIDESVTGTQPVSFTNSSFESNQASVGGSIHALSGHILINNSSFVTSSAILAGGALFSDQAANFTIEDSEFSQCVAYGFQCLSECSGGVLYLAGGSTLFSSCEFNNNSAQWGFGVPGLAIVIAGGALECDSCSFTENTIYAPGSARYYNATTISAYNGSVVLSNSDFVGNLGGLATWNTPFSSSLLVAVDQCSFIENGIPLSLSFGNVEVSSSSFLNTNITREFLPFPIQGGSLTVSNSTFSFLNRTDTGFDVSGGSITLIDSSFSSDSSTNDFTFFKLESPSVLSFIGEGLMMTNGDLWIEEVSSLNISGTFINCDFVINGGETHISNSDYLFQSTLVNSNLTVSNISFVVQQSILSESFLYAANTNVSLDGTMIVFSLNSNALDSPIMLSDSTLTIFNSTVFDSSGDIVQDVACYGDSSVVGSFGEWIIPSSCDIEFVPIVVKGSISELQLLSNGRTRYLEVELEEDESGIEISLFLEPWLSESTLSSWSDPLMMVQMFLTPSPCHYDMVVGDNSLPFIDVETTASPAVLSFDGPAPSFLHPNATGITSYCLIVNSSSPLATTVPQIQSLTTTVFKRNFTTSVVEFTPYHLRFYSTQFTVHYMLYDQWGDLFASETAIPFYSEDCLSGDCGSTYKGLSSGDKLLNFSTSPDWKLWTRVNVSLPHQSNTSVAYGNFPA